MGIGSDKEMNTPREKPAVPTWPEEAEPIAVGPWRDMRIIESGVLIYRRGESIHRNSAVMGREEAIDVAKNILLAYDVPFCNRVKGAGLA